MSVGKSLISKDLPSVSVISKSGLKALNQPPIISSMPLKTESTIISAALLTRMPSTEISEMTLMMLCCFLANRYRHAKKKAVFCCPVFNFIV